MGQTSSQPSRRKTYQSDNQYKITGHNRCSGECSDELESAEAGAAKEAWTNGTGKQKRSRRAALAFSQMVNLFTCYRGKTRVKKFKPSKSNRDNTDAHKRCFCAEKLESVEMRTETFMNAFGKQKRSREATKAFRPGFNSCRGKALAKNLKPPHCVGDKIDAYNRHLGKGRYENGTCSNQVQLPPVNLLTRMMGIKETPVTIGQNSPVARQSMTKAANSLPKVDALSKQKLFFNGVLFPLPDPCHVVAFLDELYTRRQLLGIGSFGFVFEGFRKSDGLPVAIKYVTKKQAKAVMEKEQLIPLEVALMKRVNSIPVSPHIVQLIDWFDGPIEYAMVLERPHPCQDLREFCESQGGKLSENQSRSVILQVVEALRTCLSRGVLHRDLKLSNLLIQTDTLHVKLIDFGCGAFLKDAPYEDLAGARLCLPPEVFLHKLYLAVPATVWSVGVTVFRLVCGVMPFRTEEAIVGVHLYFPNRVSAEYRRLVRWCLSPNPADRPTLEQIVLHPWFQQDHRGEKSDSHLQFSKKPRVTSGHLES